MECLYEAGILQHLKGWEDVTFQDLKDLLLDQNFDINDFPWWRLDFIVLSQVMGKSIKAIIISKENDEFLSVDLINFALNGPLTFL